MRIYGSLLRSSGAEGALHLPGSTIPGISVFISSRDEFLYIVLINTINKFFVLLMTKGF